MADDRMGKHLFYILRSSIKPVTVPDPRSRRHPSCRSVLQVVPGLRSSAVLAPVVHLIDMGIVIG